MIALFGKSVRLFSDSTVHIRTSVVPKTSAPFRRSKGSTRTRGPLVPFQVKPLGHKDSSITSLAVCLSSERTTLTSRQIRSDASAGSSATSPSRFQAQYVVALLQGIRGRDVERTPKTQTRVFVTVTKPVGARSDEIAQHKVDTPTPGVTTLVNL